MGPLRTAVSAGAAAAVAVGGYVAYDSAFVLCGRVVAAAAPRDGVLKDVLAVDGVHVDTWAVDVPGQVGAEEFARAFFTSGTFRLERVVLRALGMGHASDADIMASTFSVGDHVAAFRCVAATPSERLFCWDPALHGYSALHTVPAPNHTTLLFSSTIADGLLLRAVLPAHLYYARRCLMSAAIRTEAMRAANIESRSV